MGWELGLGGGMELGEATGDKERGQKSEHARAQRRGIKGAKPLQV